MSGRVSDSEMTGTWTEVASSRMCPRCAAEGRTSLLTHYTAVEDGFAIFQERCRTCLGVQTHVNDSSERALVAARKAQRSGRSLVFGLPIVFGVILGQLLALGALALGASALASVR